MTDLIKNGCFLDQYFTPWFSNDYPQIPELPHYMGRCFSVLLKTGNNIQQNVTVRKDAWFIARWEFTARLVEDSGDQGATLQTALFAASDNPSQATAITDTRWQVYTHTCQQPVCSHDGYLGMVLMNPLPLPDPGVRTVIQLTGIKLWVDYQGANPPGSRRNITRAQP